jgi:hypothetical protein
MAYLSKQLDAISKAGCLACMPLTATAVLMAEVNKLTLGKELTVQVPHSILTLTEYKGNY